MPEWIEWGGGVCPLPAACRVDYHMRGGAHVLIGARADALRWEHTGGGGDIIAYKLHLD